MFALGFWTVEPASTVLGLGLQTIDAINRITCNIVGVLLTLCNMLLFSQPEHPQLMLFLLLNLLFSHFVYCICLHKSASAQLVVIVVLSLLLSILLRPLVIFATVAGFSYMHFLRARDLDKFRLIPRSDPPFSH